MASDLMQAKRTKYSAYLIIYVIVVLAIIGAANWLADRYNKSFDTTATKKYSLSDETAKVVNNLKSTVNVYYVDKSDRYDRAKDILDRYKNLSTKVNVVYVDPDKRRDLALALGVTSFGDVIIENNGKKEKAKALTEEEITGAMIRVNKTGVRMACFLSGSGEHTTDDQGASGFAFLKDQLEGYLYKTKTISLVEKQQIPPDCTIIVAGGPKQDYFQPEVDAITKFVDNGGKALVLLDGVLAAGRESIGQTPTLVAGLSAWGVKPRMDVIADESPATQLGQLAPLVRTYDSHPIVAPMKGTMTLFPLVRSLELSGGAQKLFSSGEDSYSVPNAKGEVDPSKGTKGSFVLAAAGTAGTKKGRWIVVGSSDWMTNRFLPIRNVANRDLALNMFDWLSADEDLISIRPKEPEDRRLNITGVGIQTLFILSVIFLPLAVIISGVATWWKRR